MVELIPVPLSDLTVDIFFILRAAFFDETGSSQSFSLRDKRNTQDDPFDEYIAQLLANKLTDALCHKAPGPLVSPDMVIYRPAECQSVAREALASDPTRVVALEVKKLERMRSGQVARSTGLDYNTTPPCGTVRVYDATEQPLDISSFYLFACQERHTDGTCFLSALALCDGDVLNADFNMYLQITGQRQKGLGLGTYGDGVNRERPMLIFSNPLGAAQLDHQRTLISRRDLANNDTRVTPVYQIGRTIPEGGQGLFLAYRARQDVPPKWEAQLLLDPFPRPVNRVSATQARGKFKLPIRPLTG